MTSFPISFSPSLVKRIRCVLGVTSYSSLVELMNTEPTILGGISGELSASINKAISGADVPQTRLFVKFISDDMTNHGFTFKMGTNVDTVPFNGSGECRPGGLYFSRFEHFPNWVDYGPLVAFVRIPADALVYEEPCGTKLKASAIEIVEVVERDADGKWIEAFSARSGVYTESLCESVVKQDGMTLVYVPEALRTAFVCEAAVKQDGWALMYVPEALKTAYLCNVAVKQEGNALRLVPDALKTASLCEVAAKQNGNALFYVPEALKTASLCEVAVNQKVYAIEYVPEAIKTASLCETAVKQDGFALELVPEGLMTASLCEAAVKQNRLAFMFVPDALIKSVSFGETVPLSRR